MNADSDFSRPLDLDDFGRRWGVSRATVEKWIEDGDLPAVEVNARRTRGGRRLRITAANEAEFIRRRTVDLRDDSPPASARRSSRSRREWV